MGHIVSSCFTGQSAMYRDSFRADPPDRPSSRGRQHHRRHAHADEFERPPFRQIYDPPSSSDRHISKRPPKPYSQVAPPMVSVQDRLERPRKSIRYIYVENTVYNSTRKRPSYHRSSQCFERRDFVHRRVDEELQRKITEQNAKIARRSPHVALPKKKVRFVESDAELAKSMKSLSLDHS